MHRKGWDNNLPDMLASHGHALLEAYRSHIRKECAHENIMGYLVTAALLPPFLPRKAHHSGALRAHTTRSYSVGSGCMQSPNMPLLPKARADVVSTETTNQAAYMLAARRPIFLTWRVADPSRAPKCQTHATPLA